MQTLTALTQLARKLKDRPLECAVFDMRADYYSVNWGFNKRSTSYYRQAVHFAHEHHLDKEVAIYLHRQALYYFVYSKYSTAADYFLQANERFRKYGLNRFPQMGIYFMQEANLYFSIEDWANARTLLQTALKYELPSGRHRMGIMNTLGLIYRNTQQYPKAISYFSKALHIAKLQHDSIWIAITSGNIGSIYFLTHQYRKALPLITTDYIESFRFGENRNAVAALLRLVKINLDSGSLSSAQVQLVKAAAILHQLKNEALKLKVNYYSLEAQANEQSGNLQQALYYHKIFELANDSLTRRDNIAAVERVRLNYEMERSAMQLNQVKNDAANSAFKRNAIIVLLLLIVVISFLVYHQQRLEANRNKELFKAEKQNAEAERANAAVALANYTQSLKEKNRLIDEFQVEVDRLQLQHDNHYGALQLAQLMQVHLMTDESWEEFKRIFSGVHRTFFYNLRKQFPHLTATDTRLMALIKLNLNGREMAGMLGITPDGVKKARQRLRKKININNDEELSNLLATL
ncbi:hypothetical protein GCM10027037_28950 [Mucilaginibacter koreensis]